LSRTGVSERRETAKRIAELEKLAEDRCVGVGGWMVWVWVWVGGLHWVACTYNLFTREV
jgi:hypothetical protein